MQATRTCSFPDCSRDHYAKSLCKSHYMQAHRGKSLGPIQEHVSHPDRCSFPGCDRPYAGKGLCDSHLSQRRRGSELTPLEPRRTGCSVDGCDGKHKGRGYCEKHLARYRRHGATKDPDFIEDPALRFASRIEKTDTCWLWMGSLGSYGYGNIRCGDGRKTPAHRFSYELHVGPIPDGMHIDHLCRVRSCVNPDHLQPVTPRENDYRGRMAAKLDDEAFRRWIDYRRWVYADARAAKSEKRTEETADVAS